MRLLLVTERYAPEARSNAHIYQDLAEGLARRGYDVTVLTKMPADYIPEGGAADDARLPRDSVENQVRVLRIKESFGPKRAITLRALDQVFFGFRVLWRMLRLPRPDRLIVYSPPLPLAGLVGLYARVRGLTCILNLHDLYPRTPIELGVLRNPILIRAAQILEDMTYRCAAHFLVPSPGSSRYLAETKKIPRDQVHLVYNWVDTREVVPAGQDNGFRSRHQLAEQFLVSYAGVMGYAQDLSSTIACAAQMAAEPDTVFYLVGDGVYRERWVQEARGLRNVRFLPNLARKDYLDLLRASDVCLAPLTVELQSPAIPGKIQNIMAVGRPVVAIVPQDSEAARVIQESGAGFVVAPGDAAGLRKALSRLRADPALRQAQGEAGRRFAEENFDLGQALSRIEAVLRTP